MQAKHVHTKLILFPVSSCDGGYHASFWHGKAASCSSKYMRFNQWSSEEAQSTDTATGPCWGCFYDKKKRTCKDKPIRW